jgi:phage-related protein/predicted XRE-type DNA-binding protein
LYNQISVPSLKPITWLGDSLARLRTAPKDIRSNAGYQLGLVQRGETPADFKPMPDVGAGVMEIRLHGDNEFRVFYVARFEEAVYVLHSFVKKTRATRKIDIDLGKAIRRDAVSEERTHMKSINGTTVTKGSGDVFADLGFSPAESRNLRIRSEMMSALRSFIEKEALTQADAARRLNVSQPRISDLTRGKISRFSLDTLVNMLTDAGLEVDFRIKPSRRRVA